MIVVCYGRNSFGFMGPKAIVGAHKFGYLAFYATPGKFGLCVQC